MSKRAESPRSASRGLTEDAKGIHIPMQGAWRALQALRSHVSDCACPLRLSLALLAWRKPLGWLEHAAQPEVGHLGCETPPISLHMRLV